MKLFRTVLATCLVGMVAARARVVAEGAVAESEIRVGMIGLDTSHVVAFTELLNDEK